MDLEAGLSSEEAAERQRRYGPNLLPIAPPRSVRAILVQQFRSLIVLLLVLAAAVSFAFSQWTEGFAIAVVILINAAIGFVTELRATRSMEALRRLGTVSARVRRQGRIQEVPASSLVPGDVVLIEGGDIVPADLRLCRGSRLEADESALTGESAPVGKGVAPVVESAPLADRTSLLFTGTAVTRGSGEGLVVATGAATELGQIAALASETEQERTPLERRLDQFGQRLLGVTLGIAAIVGLSGVLRGRELFLMIQTAIALAVATIPEGLPIVATTALARGMWRMARRNALVNRLSAVETLGATTVICTDKTGTLTENRMVVSTLVLEEGRLDLRRGEFLTEGGERADPAHAPALRQALEIAALCADATLDAEAGPNQPTAIGDPMEIALLRAARQAGIRREVLLAEQPEVREEAFDADLRMMATFHERAGRFRIAVKGAPEAVLARSRVVLLPDGERPLTPEVRARWLEANRRLAEEGFRVLALATRWVSSAEAAPYEDLTFVGLVGLLDPPREDVRPAVESCRQAGVRVVMVTGDQAATARNVAEAVGLAEPGAAHVVAGDELRPLADLPEQERRRLLEATIFARVSPRQKLHLVDLHQHHNNIVAMTGDGVNDAPALKKSDIGVAMGLRGTQVAREAADMVLLDDSFSTIVFALEQGRVIFRNIRRFVLYLLSCNLSEVLIVGLASVLDAPLPILPLQILFLNLVTDVFPALALGVGESERAVMRRPPRYPREPILAARHWRAVAGYGLLIAAVVLLALGLCLAVYHMEPPRAVTVSFLTLAFAQLWHAFNMRDADSRLLSNDVVRNHYLWGALALCTGLLLAAVYLSPLAGVLKVVNPGRDGWLIIISMSLTPLLVGQLGKVLAASLRPSSRGHVPAG